MPVLNLVAKNGDVFPVDVQVMVISEIIKNMIEDVDIQELDKFPLPNIDSDILSLIVKYCEFHYQATKNNIPIEDINKWDEEFINFTPEQDNILEQLTLAANYLDIKILLDLTCKRWSDYIDECDGDPEAVRKRFNIVNDFTPEEQEQLDKDIAPLRQYVENIKKLEKEYNIKAPVLPMPTPWPPVSKSE